MKFKDTLYLPAYFNQVEYIISVDHPFLVGKLLLFKQESDLNRWLQKEKNYSYVNVHPDYFIYLLEAGTLADEIELSREETDILLRDMAAWYLQFKIMPELKKYNRYRVDYVPKKSIL